jgi:hypothetical protein
VNRLEILVVEKYRLNMILARYLELLITEILYEIIIRVTMETTTKTYGNTAIAAKPKFGLWLDCLD